MDNDRFTLTQEEHEMLKGRRAIDTKIEEFMRASIEDRMSIREQVVKLDRAVAGNTQTINEMHTALFAKDDDNEFGVAGLMVNMQKIVKHTEVTCNIARFLKWSTVSVLGVVVPILAGLHYLGLLQ